MEKNCMEYSVTKTQNMLGVGINENGSEISRTKMWCH